MSLIWYPNGDEIFNPNNWGKTEHEYRIYLDDNAFEYVVVDEFDYLHFIQWKWHVNKPHATRSGKKRYACRSQSNGLRYKPKLYLHVEIMNRTGILPPSSFHTIVDHRDGNEFNCRRSNLRWATPVQNRLNLHGAYPTDLLEDLRGM